MSWQSKVPAAILGLISALEVESSLSGVSVLDGPTVTSAQILEAITVGFTSEERPEAVSANLATGGMSIVPSRERFTINCAVHVLNGAGNVSAARTRAYMLLGGAGAALAANKTLGGVVMSSGIGDHVLSQTQAQKGALIEVVFGVDCDAFTAR